MQITPQRLPKTNVIINMAFMFNMKNLIISRAGV
jgi:hypothetical protein